MSGNKVQGFLQRNVVMITGISIIVATHWGWNVLQQNPRLVPEDQKKEMPIIIGLKLLSKEISDKFDSMTGGGTTNTTGEEKKQ